ncbi:hypothetical protein N0V83_007968 [Neocucurbitaria cava]|uniref:Uncharacterized protein n=1 Tax=Neocucurbitaria cava TaxID=798079 RepID=A0A9W9CK36_9PLEO|nr:hypothetical protein N0V83_007968 [Neocucurbitaria cava]
MCEPFSVGAIFASVGSAFRFADLAVRIAEVGSENEVFVRTIHVVRDDLDEAERLLNTDTLQRKLTSLPGRATWVRSALNNTKSALNEIGKWVERARAEQEATGSIPFNTRVRWVFNDHEKIVNRTTELMACHQQLSNVLSYLIRLEDIPSHVEPPTYQDTTHYDEIISRHKRKSVWKAADATPTDQKSTDANGYHEASRSPGIDTEVLRPISINEYQNMERSFLTPASSVSILEPHSTPLSETHYPQSPPPTYASAVQSNAQIQHIPLDDKRYSDGKNLEKNFVRPPLAGENIRHSCPVLSKPTNTWAYQLAQPHLPVSELAGDTVLLSGTNTHGPVNPYEYCPAPQLSSLSTSSEQDKTQAVAELLGDFRFAVELPSNDPGPPPGYPRRSSRNPTFRTSYNSMTSSVTYIE